MREKQSTKEFAVWKVIMLMNTDTFSAKRDTNTRSTINCGRYLSYHNRLLKNVFTKGRKCYCFVNYGLFSRRLLDQRYVNGSWGRVDSGWCLRSIYMSI